MVKHTKKYRKKQRKGKKKYTRKKQRGGDARGIFDRGLNIGKNVGKTLFGSVYSKKKGSNMDGLGGALPGLAAGVALPAKLGYDTTRDAMSKVGNLGQREYYASQKNIRQGLYYNTHTQRVLEVLNKVYPPGSYVSNYSAFIIAYNQGHADNNKKDKEGILKEIYNNNMYQVLNHHVIRKDIKSPPTKFITLGINKKNEISLLEHEDTNLLMYISQGNWNNINDNDKKTYSNMHKYIKTKVQATGRGRKKMLQKYLINEGNYKRIKSVPCRNPVLPKPPYNESYSSKDELLAAMKRGWSSSKSGVIAGITGFGQGVTGAVGAGLTGVSAIGGLGVGAVGGIAKGMKDQFDDSREDYKQRNKQIKKEEKQRKVRKIEKLRQRADDMEKENIANEERKYLKKQLSSVQKNREERERERADSTKPMEQNKDSALAPPKLTSDEQKAEAQAQPIEEKTSEEEEKISEEPIEPSPGMLGKRGKRGTVLPPPGMSGKRGKKGKRNTPPPPVSSNSTPPLPPPLPPPKLTSDKQKAAAQEQPIEEKISEETSEETIEPPLPFPSPSKPAPSIPSQVKRPSNIAQKMEMPKRQEGGIRRRRRRKTRKRKNRRRTNKKNKKKKRRMRTKKR